MKTQKKPATRKKLRPHISIADAVAQGLSFKFRGRRVWTRETGQQVIAGPSVGLRPNSFSANYSLLTTRGSIRNEGDATLQEALDRAQARGLQIGADKTGDRDMTVRGSDRRRQLAHAKAFHPLLAEIEQTARVVGVAPTTLCGRVGDNGMYSQLRQGRTPRDSTVRKWRAKMEEMRNAASTVR